MNGFRVTLLPLLIALLFVGFTAFTVVFACVIIVPFDCKFAGSKFIGIYVYEDGLGYRFIATAIL